MKLQRYFRLILTCLVVLLVLGAMLFFFKEYVYNYYVRLKLDNIAIPNKNSRLLVFAPHSDDETLGCGILIRSTIQNGGKVKVVLVTNGDGFRQALQFDEFKLKPRPQDYIKFGYQRQQETIKALKRLGLSEKDIIFLGYPDGGINHLWSSHWDATNPYTSPYTHRSRSPYSDSFTKNASFTGASLAADITKIIQEYKPTQIAFPHPNDRHPDHWATNAFVNYVLMRLNYTPDKEWLYLVHRGDWPTPMKTDFDMYLVPPAKLADTGTRWYALDMSRGETKIKAQAIHCYKTQMGVLRPLLDSFERKNELFGEYGSIPLHKFSGADNLIAPNKANQVIIDPLQDYLRLEISKNADVSSVYAEMSKGDDLHLFIEADANIKEFITYNLNLVFFNGRKISRLNLAVVDDKIIVHKVFKDSITNRAGIKANASGKVLHVVIPRQVTGPYQHVFVNATTAIGDYTMDKTAWRMLDAP